MTNNPQESTQKEGTGRVISSVTNAINQMSGEEGKANIQLGELFSGIFKKHSKEERERLLSAGVSGNIPDERSMIARWPRPWLYSRVFAVLFLLTLLIYLILFSIYHSYLTSTMILLAVLTTPVSLMVFLFECNIPQNISLIDCVAMSLVGGVASLLLTVLSSRLFQINSTGQTWYGAVLTAIFEMIGITALTFAYIRKRGAKYLLNGILIGASVGAGFCILENFGYLYTLSAQCASYYGDGLIYISYFRPELFRCWIFSIGTHVVWGALIGAGFAAAGQDAGGTSGVLKNPRFLRFLLATLLLETVYYAPLPANPVWLSYFVPAVIAVIGLVLLLFQISAGLRQINRLSDEAWQADAAAMPEEAED